MILACVDAGNRFMTPSEVVREIKPVSVCECTQEMTCSTFGTMSHWNGNVMQDEAIRKIYRPHPRLAQAPERGPLPLHAEGKLLHPVCLCL